MAINEILTLVNSDLTKPLNKKIDELKIEVDKRTYYETFLDLPNLKYGKNYLRNNEPVNDLRTVLEVQGSGYLCGCLSTGQDLDKKYNMILKCNSTAKFKLTIDDEIKLWLEVTAIPYNSEISDAYVNSFGLGNNSLTNYGQSAEFNSSQFSLQFPYGLIISPASNKYTELYDASFKSKGVFIPFSKNKQSFRHSSLGSGRSCQLTKIMMNLGIRFEKNFKIEANWGYWNYLYSLDD